MAKDQKRRRQNRALKKAGLGMKWQRHFNSQQEWSEAVNSLLKKNAK